MSETGSPDLEFLNVTARNFMSFGAVTQGLDISLNDLTLLLGYLMDGDGNIKRNGCGKSTIAQALSYGWFGKPLEKIKADNLINNVNEKNMLVTVEARRDGNLYRVERGRKPAVLRFYKNGESFKKDDENFAKGENSVTQEDIDEVLGMDHTMFCNIISLSTLSQPFLLSPAGDQRDVIEKLLGITKLSARAKALGKKITASKTLISQLEGALQATIESNSRIKLAAEGAKAKVEAWNTSHAKKITELTETLALTSAIDFDAELAALGNIAQYDRDKTDLEAAKVIKVREIEMAAREQQAHEAEIARLRRLAEQIDPTGERANFERAQRSLVENVSNQTAKKTRLTQNLDDYIEDKRKIRERGVQRISELETAKDAANGSECSVCGQGLDGTNHLDTIVAKLDQQIADAKLQLETHDTTVSAETVRLTVEVGKQQNEIEAAEAALLAHSELEATIEQTIADDKARREKALADALTLATTTDTASIEAELAGIVTALAGLGARPTAMFSSQAEVFEMKQGNDAIATELERLSAETNPHEDSVQAFLDTIKEIDEGPLEHARKLLSHQELMNKLLINKDSFVRKRIIDQNLHNLNQRITFYMDKLEPERSVKFKNDLSVEIMHLGKDYDFPQLSRGERNRVIMAMAWAFRDLWESLNVSTNLLFVDELLDSGLDVPGTEAALKILKTMGRDRKKNVFLVSHREELRGRIDRTLLVSKEDGFTRLDYDQY